MSNLSLFRSKRFFLISLGALLLSYLRAFQVFAFMIIAGTRRMTSRERTLPDTFKTEWPETRSLTPVRSPTSRCFITLHPWYIRFDPTLISQCLEEVRALGASGVRTDIRWKDIMPDGRYVDQHAVDWFRSYLSVIRNSGLRPLAVLSDPPVGILRLGDKERLTCWREYITAVVHNCADFCDSYQVLNELNNPVYRFISRQNIPEAIRSASTIIHLRQPNAEVSINVLCDLLRWKWDLNWYLKELPGLIDVVGLDFYPETWTVSLSDPWRRIRREIHELVEGALAGRNPRVAVMETGYSTNIPFFRGERQQASFYRKLGQLLREADDLGNGRSLAFVGLYELCDDRTDATLDPEAHFGVLTTQPWRRKIAFAEVQRLCRMLS